MSDAIDLASGTDGIHVIPAEARPFQGRHAGIVSRILAAGVDAVIVVLSVGALYLVWAGALFLLHGRRFRFPSPGLAQVITAGIVVFILYCTVAWTVAGRTYGGHVLGLRVIGRHGQGVSALAAFARAILSAAFPVGLLWCAVSSQSRSVQDLIVGTSVIYDWELRPRGSGPSPT